MLLFIYLPDGLVGLLIPCVVLIMGFFITTFVFAAKVLSDFQFKTPDLKYVIGKKLHVPGNKKNNSALQDQDKVSALEFLGIDGKINEGAGKF